MRTRTHTRTRTRTRKSTRIHVHLHVCIHVHAHIYMCTRTCTEQSYIVYMAWISINHFYRMPAVEWISIRYQPFLLHACGGMCLDDNLPGSEWTFQQLDILAPQRLEADAIQNGELPSWRMLLRRQGLKQKTQKTGVRSSRPP